MTGEGSVFQINVSRGGVPKTPIEADEVEVSGLSRDRQAWRNWRPRAIRSRQGAQGKT